MFVAAPINALKAEDVRLSVACLAPVRQRGYVLGVMLVPVKGWAGFAGDLGVAQREAFRTIARADDIHVAVVMAPNLPWRDADWFHDPDGAGARVRTAIDFAASLTEHDGEPYVTFHLNALLTREEWARIGVTDAERERACDHRLRTAMLPALASLAGFARDRGVRLAIETTPVPEFGDRPESELNTLVNPFPLYAGRGFDDVRSVGIGIVLDLCHTQTLYAAASRIAQHGAQHPEITAGLFPHDVERLAAGSLLDDVRALRDGDLVHVNDGRGRFDPTAGTLHEEGVALGAGDTPNMPALLAALTTTGVPIVFEINERSYTERTQLDASIAYYLSHASMPGARKE